MPAPTPIPAEQYRKTELDRLIERLQSGDEAVVYECVVFIIAESFGYWHGRARAKMCRTLKNHAPDTTLCVALVSAIIRRLETGCFSEQFKDQLRMAIRFEPERLRTTAQRLTSSNIPWTRRYAAWILTTMTAQGLIPGDTSTHD